MPITDQPKSEPSNAALIAIGIFKLVKSVLLICLGIGLVYWRDENLSQVFSSWIDSLWVGRFFFDNLVSKVSLLPQPTLDKFAAGSFIFAGLLLVEGTGLCLRKRWAEYLTIALTASLLPFEIHSLLHHLTALGTCITLVNMAILGYLVIQILRSRSR